MLLKTGENFDLSRGYTAYRNRAFVKFEIIFRAEDLEKRYQIYEYQGKADREREKKADIVCERVVNDTTTVYIYHRRPAELSEEDLAILTNEYLGFGYTVGKNEDGELLLRFSNPAEVPQQR